MSAMLIKETPDDLRFWLKEEARLNRRSLNQQVIVCLEWCRHMYGAAQMRNPFADVDRQAYPRGKQLADRLANIPQIKEADAKSMKRSADEVRKGVARDFDYACFA